MLYWTWQSKGSLLCGSLLRWCIGMVVSSLSCTGTPSASCHRRTFSCKGFVCGCARSSIISPGCVPKRSMAAPQSFRVPAPVPAQSSFSFSSIPIPISDYTVLCSGRSSHLRLPWYRRHAPGNLSYGAAPSTTCMSSPRAVVSVTSHMRPRASTGRRARGQQSS